MPVNKNVMHVLSASHTFWYQLSGGVFGSRLAGMPRALLLFREKSLNGHGRDRNVRRVRLVVT